MVLDDDVLTYCMESGVDSSTCVLYLLEPLPDGDVSNLIPSSEASSFLDVAAGAREGAGIPIDEKLAADLAVEIQHLITKASRGMLAKTHGLYRCPACPFRCFDRIPRVTQHLHKYHTIDNQFCCSGTKQIRVVLALHDSDMHRLANYIARSADVIRRLVKPALSHHHNQIDRHTRLLLDDSGPTLVNACVLAQDLWARRVGNLWYSHLFAERIFQEMLLNHAKAG